MQSIALELSFHHAQDILKKWLRKPVVCTGIRRLHGGEIHAAFSLEFDCAPYRAVIKLRNPDDESFAGEKERLEHLDQHGMPVPDVYDLGDAHEQGAFFYILLEMLPGVPLDAARMTANDRRELDRALAAEVLKLHANTRDTFGEIDGRFATKRWADIVVPQLVDMRDEVTDKLPAGVLSHIDVALASAKAVFAESQSVPTLIHGDLWAGNIMVNNENGTWRLSGFIDPGTQYADVEHELAYLQCFDTVGQDFFDAYTARTPMRPGFELRKLYYWLKTMMIHVWLFGEKTYGDRTARVAEKIATQTRGG